MIRGEATIQAIDTRIITREERENLVVIPIMMILGKEVTGDGR